MQFKIGKYLFYFGKYEDNSIKEPELHDYWEGMYGDYGVVMNVIETCEDYNHYFPMVKYIKNFRDRYWTLPYNNVPNPLRKDPRNGGSEYYHKKMEEARHLKDKLDSYMMDHFKQVNNGNKEAKPPSINYKEIIRERNIDSILNDKS